MSLSTYALAGAIALAATTAASAQPLRIVNVNSPAVLCVFSPTCTTTGTDSSGSISIPGMAGTGKLQTRTIVGRAGTPAAGRTIYLYRVDMTQTAGPTAPYCVSRLRVNFGPDVLLDYDRAGGLEDAFVVTSGGSGTIGLFGADRVGSSVTFTFWSWVCSGASIGRGQSSFFFGLASARGPRAITAQILIEPGSTWRSVAARAPAF